MIIGNGQKYSKHPKYLYQVNLFRVFLYRCLPHSNLAARTLKGNKNPVVLTTNPFNKQCYQFRIQVTKLGSWIGVGVAELTVTLSGSRTVGTQEHCINSGYFWQNTGINVIKMHGEPNAIQANPIKVYISYILSNYNYMFR
jgi:hypothetical protein